MSPVRLVYVVAWYFGYIKHSVVFQGDERYFSQELKSKELAEKCGDEWTELELSDKYLSKIDSSDTPISLLKLLLLQPSPEYFKDHTIDYSFV